MKGFSENPCACKLVQRFAFRESEMHIILWIIRVPFLRNIADGPSRNDLKLLMNLNIKNDSSDN